ncbi:hypothetical protein D1632_16445 [Chryseobacterium nematophagum]|uniref:Uncharacterized protein n=1 Tax=Chryseobacterium nematophagum TaxID=2305228 RepID=A0A3M7L654_9FLAO|nr:hypothetical protein D1632_16445 [Chryseobacterium nematophagum]
MIFNDQSIIKIFIHDENIKIWRNFCRQRSKYTKSRRYYKKRISKK